jgi:predicted alpha/beta superfamily hydrolase
MKKLLLAAFVLSLAACTVPVKENKVTTGKITTVYSKILGEKREIWIYAPDDVKDAGKHYPVLYLLDGDQHFNTVVGMVQQLSQANDNTVIPPMIVVGILNTDRTRDLTPTNSLYGPEGTKVDGFQTSGGGEKFESFIEKELIPHIDSAYHPAPYKMLVGHSFGGLTAMNIVVHHTSMFNSYVVIDPSMWWDKRKLLNEAGKMLKQAKMNGQSLYLGIANTMPAGMDTLQVRFDSTGKTAHIRSILALKDTFQHSKGNGLRWAYGYYKNDDHSSAPLITIYDGLRFIFDFYKPPAGMFNQIADEHSKADPAALYSAHYAEVSKRMGFTILPPEPTINELGYYYMQQKAKEKALSMFSLNVKNYPNSANVYDSMGDYYNYQNDKTKAAEYYKKSLKLQPNPGTQKKLEELTK